MKEERASNFTNQPFDPADTVQHWKHVFRDSLVLDDNYIIRSAGDVTQEITGFRENEIIGKSVDIFGSDLMNQLRHMLAPGFFSETWLPLITRGGATLRFGVSGFYSGLVTEVNGYIILQIRSVHELKKLMTLLRAKSAEIDSFIYAASHQIRGPIATLKGLIYLARNKPPAAELDFIHNEIENFAEVLDRRLNQLIKISGNFEAPDKNTVEMKGADLRKIALETADEYAGWQDRITVCHEATKDLTFNISEEKLASLFSSLFAFIFLLPGDAREVGIKTIGMRRHLMVCVRTTGVTINPLWKSALTGDQKNFSLFLNYPQLESCYQFYRTATSLSAIVTSEVLSEKCIDITLRIPDSAE